MRELIKAVDDPFAVSFIDQAAVKAINSIREYFAEGDKRKQVADWMEEVIDNHKNGLLASPETTSSSSPSPVTSSPTLSNLSSPTPARRRRPAKKVKASLYETPNLPFSILDDIPVIAPTQLDLSFASCTV